MAQTNNKVVKRLCFHSDIKEEKDALALVGASKGLAVSLISIALLELKESYGLDESDPEGMRTFIKSYPFLRRKLGKEDPYA